MKLSARLLIAGFASLAVAGAAAAPALATTTTPGPLTASTHVTNRSDNGGGGTWAKDSFVRTVQLTLDGLANPVHCAGQVPCVHYFYKIVDGANGGANGGFVTIPGALAPNQGPGHTGQHVQWTFGSFTPIFIVAGCAYLLALLVVHLINPRYESVTKLTVEN